jgi:DNA-directed RNA polymerase specialized sigma24 family protein
VSDGHADGHPSIEQRTLQREAVRRLYDILDGLEAKQRVAYALHVLEGRPLAEVADLTESTVVATKLRVWRARQTVESRARHDPLLKDYVGEAKAREEAEP